VILVANEKAKEKIPEELGLALVLTVYEAKGLEFDDVLLYNFFTDSEVRAPHWVLLTQCRSVPEWGFCSEAKSLVQVPVSVVEHLALRVRFRSRWGGGRE
jgi:hypothetical protein